jgi:ornithine cyclodeaminase/alanine dehydrogenase-like protein (mu-crystallin family)
MVLSRSQVDSLVDVDEAIEILRDGFRCAPEAPAPLRIRTDLPGPGTATCLMPGLLPGLPAYTVKVNAKFPDASPALRLTALGADEPGKVELSGDLLRGARVIVDDVRLATSVGALAGAGLAAAGTLGDVLRGGLPAHGGASVYAPVGLPWQDLAITWLVYQRAATADVTVIDLLG